MANPLERYVEMAAGLTSMTVQSAERLVQRLVKEGEVAADRAERTVSDLLDASQRNRQALVQLVRHEVERAVDRLNLVRRSDLDEFEGRLLRAVRSMEPGGAGSRTPAPSAPSAPSAEPAAADMADITAADMADATGSPAASRPVKTSSAAKRVAAAKKTTAAQGVKSSGQKSSGRKSPARKSAADKTAGTKSGSKKSTTRTTTAKKASTKKSTAQKKAPRDAGAGGTDTDGGAT